jgi:hypothetical protein
VIRWTRLVLRHRRTVLASWLVLVVLGVWGTANVGKLLTNRFSVPGSDAERGLDILRTRFNERGDGAFTLVVRGTRTLSPATAQAAAQSAAAQVPSGRAGPPRPAGPGVDYVQITTPLQAADAKNYVDRMRSAIGPVAGARTYLTGFPALAHDEQPVYNHDLSRGETVAGSRRRRSKPRRSARRRFPARPTCSTQARKCFRSAPPVAPTRARSPRSTSSTRSAAATYRTPAFPPPIACC